MWYKNKTQNNLTTLQYLERIIENYGLFFDVLKDGIVPQYRDSSSFSFASRFVFIYKHNCVRLVPPKEQRKLDKEKSRFERTKKFLYCNNIRYDGLLEALIQKCDNEWTKFNDLTVVPPKRKMPRKRRMPRAVPNN